MVGGTVGCAVQASALGYVGNDLGALMQSIRVRESDAAEPTILVPPISEEEAMARYWGPPPTSAATHDHDGEQVGDQRVRCCRVCRLGEPLTP